jgi:hypothetical protein
VPFSPLFTGEPPPVGHNRTIADSIGLVDATAFVGPVHYAYILTDTIVAADAVGTALSVPVGGSPIYPGSGTYPGSALYPSGPDTVGLADSVEATRTLAITLTDAVGLLDAADRAANSTRTLTDSAGVLDTAGRAASYALTQADPIGLLDAASRVVRRAWSAGHDRPNCCASQVGAGPGRACRRR